MSFEEILRQWEQRTQKEEQEDTRRRREQLKRLLDRYPPDPAAKGEKPEAEVDDGGGKPRAPTPGSLPIDDQIDLHGMTVEEACAATERFMEASLAAGHRKVLVVHGKGLHSDRGGVLRRAIRQFLEKHPAAGAMGTPKQRDGGSGALWVVLRHRSR
ncbi:MAG: Smr/MutS family protein [Spirochaetaceae bacterium]